MAVFAQYIILLGGGEDLIVERCRKGGEGPGSMWGEEKTRRADKPMATRRRRAA